MRNLFTRFLMCFILLGFGKLSAQDIYQKHFGTTGSDHMTDMLRLTDGSFVSWGYSVKATGDSSFAQLVKLDSNMNVLWTKTFIFNNQMRTTDLTLAANGGFFLAGRTWQTPTAATKQGGFVIKTDATGNLTWSRIIKFDGTETMTKVIEETDGTLRYFVTGTATTSYLKAAATGDPTTTAANPTNGAFDFLAKKVVRMSANRYAVVGGFNAISSDHIIMLNQDTIQWTREYNGILNVGRIFNLTTDAAGNIFITGDYLAGNFPMRQIFAAKLTQDGGLRWGTVLPLIMNGGRGIDTAWRFTIGNHIQLSGSRLYISGNMLNEQKGLSYGTISAFDTVAPTTAIGRNWLWTRQYGTRSAVGDSLVRVFVGGNGQLLGVGSSVLGGNVGKPNFFAVKTDPNGVSSCNFSSYSPVEQVSAFAYLAILRPFVGLAPPLSTIALYNDAIPTTGAMPVSSTQNVCSAQICPAGTVMASINPTRICRFDTITVAASGGTSYLWTSAALGDARVDSTFRFRAETEGNYTFNVAIQPRGNTCFATQSISVTVSPLPSAGLSAARFMCSGDSLSIATGALSANIVTWSSSSNSPWRAGGAATNIVAKPVTQGVHTYNVQVRDAVTSCINTNSTTITVRPNVVPTVDFEQIGCPGPDLTLRAVGTNEGATPFFDWIIDGNLINGRREVFIPNALGKSVQVQMTVAGDVCPAPPTTRQVRSIVRITACRVGTQELTNANRVLVYPNPNDGNFTVKVETLSAKTVSFRIVNLLGQTVETVAPRAIGSGVLEQSFDVSGLSSGMYLLETRLDDKVRFTKIQIQ